MKIVKSGTSGCSADPHHESVGAALTDAWHSHRDEANKHPTYSKEQIYHRMKARHYQTLWRQHRDNEVHD